MRLVVAAPEADSIAIMVICPFSEVRLQIASLLRIKDRDAIQAIFIGQIFGQYNQRVFDHSCVAISVSCELNSIEGADALTGYRCFVMMKEKSELCLTNFL